MNNDLISREALKNLLLDSRPDNIQQSDINFDTCDIKIWLSFVLKIIDNAPTVEIPTELCKGCRFLKDCETCEEKLRPQGEWLDHSEDGFVECPICGHWTTCEDNIDELHYCWNCGAYMRKGGAE